MATATIPASRKAAAPTGSSLAAPGILRPAYTLWLREIVRFYRQPARVVGVVASPLLFWVALGSGFAHSFQPAPAANPGTAAAASAGNYLAYLFPGSVILIVLFTAIFSMMSLIQDRNEGFLLSVLAAPISRSAIVLGKVLGGATLSAIQGVLFLAFAPLIGIHLGLASVAVSLLVIALVSFSITALGFAVAWPMDSTQAFHAVVNLLLIPLWLLSGAMFPAAGASGWLRLIMRLNPLSYGVDALRNSLLPASPTLFPLLTNLTISAGFCLFAFLASWAIVNRRTHQPAA